MTLTLVFKEWTECYEEICLEIWQWPGWKRDDLLWWSSSKKDEGRFAQNKDPWDGPGLNGSLRFFLFHFHPLLTQVHLHVLVSQFSLESSIGERARRAHSECFSWKRPQKLSYSPLLILPIKGLRLNRGVNLSKVSDWLVSGPGQEARFFNSRPVFFPLYEDFPSHFSLLIYFCFKQQNPVFSKQKLMWINSELPWIKPHEGPVVGP